MVDRLKKTCLSAPRDHQPSTINHQRLNKRMTFLPIVDRELRVAARKRNTFYLRVVAALIALVIGGGFMVLSLLPFGGMTPFGGRGQMGRPVFAVLTWLGLGMALRVGRFLPSGCVGDGELQG